MTLLNGALLQNIGPAATPPSLINANYAIIATDRWLLVDATAGAVALTLTPTGLNRGQLVFIQKIDATNNPVTISDGAVVRGGLILPANGENYASMTVGSTGLALAIN